MRVERHLDVETFLDRAGAFLGDREAEHNLILGISSSIRAGLHEAPPYMAAVLAGDQVVAAAIRTPPWRLVLSEIDDPAAIELLVEDLAGDAPPGGPLPGVMGPVGHATAFAAGWSDRTGVGHVLAMSERIFRLGRVVAPRPVSGRACAATPDDRRTLVDWQTAFELEALGEPEPVDAARTVDRWLTTAGRALVVWEDPDPVSMCGISRSTPNGSRIGPVYTPPERRGRGYASALVAAASAGELEAGQRFCFLFTDLANPTANRIYEAIGYEAVRDVEVYRFGS
jgi:GNAT superfamily N-acetyltransferase